MLLGVLSDKAFLLGGCRVPGLWFCVGLCFFLSQKSRKNLQCQKKYVSLHHRLHSIQHIYKLKTI